MSDDIFIKQDQVLGQQPYIARVPANAQEPNIRQQNQPVNRTAQQPSSYQNRTPTTYRHPASAQEPNIREARQPGTYNHRSPFTYDHRSPFTYDHRSPSTYNHRSPSSYQHQSPSTYRDPRTTQEPSTYDHRSPFTYRNPTTKRSPFEYDHRSPLTYSHASPFTYDHRSPSTYDHRSPSTYDNRQPGTYDHRSPFTYDHRSPSTYDHRSPSTYDNREPATYDHRSPAIYNIQTPSIYQNPVIYDAIEGDSTGQNTGFSAPNWDKQTVTQRPAGQTADAFAAITFSYQTAATGTNGQPFYNYGNSADERGSVHLFYNGGGSNAYAILYFNVVSIDGSPANTTPTVDDTYAVHVKYDVSSQAANQQGHVPTATNGGSKQTNTYYQIYSGSSSSGSYNGTVTQRYFQWKARSQPQNNYQNRNSMCQAYDLEFTLRLSKSGQTSIYSIYDANRIWLVANSGIGFL